MQLDYQNALSLLQQHNQNESLVRHGIAVGASMATYAERFGEDVVRWRIAGLLHDVDYEKHPAVEEHARVGAGWLAASGYPDDIVHAVIAHNDIHGVPRDDLMSRTLFACDELCGLITATALVRPDKSIHGLGVAAVRKKMKDKAFARGVNREDIVRGSAELGVPLDEHIETVIFAMTREAAALGLDGAHSGA